MSKPKIIALTSVRGQSGKDTLIEQLELNGFVVARVAFGDVLKEQCATDMAGYDFTKQDLLRFFHGPEKDAAMPGLAIKHVTDSPYKRWLIDTAERDSNQWMQQMRTPRWHLQQYGTNFRRVHLDNPNVWLDEGMKLIAEFQSNSAYDLIVVSDLRQQNEYFRLTQEGAAMVRLQRMWFKAGIDDQAFHVTDLDLIGRGMDAVVLNVWGEPGDMVQQLYTQGVIQ